MDYHEQKETDKISTNSCGLIFLIISLVTYKK